MTHLVRYEQAIAKTQTLLAVPETFLTTALSFPSQVDKALALLADVPSANEFMARADMLAHYARRVKVDTEVMNAIQYGKIKIAAKIGELSPPKPPDDRGQGRNGKKKSTVVGAVDLATHTIAKYRKVHRNLPKLDDYRDACGSDQELTTDGFVRFATGTDRAEKENSRERRRQENRRKVEEAEDPVEAAKYAKYATIVIDPPWDWGDEGDQDQLGRARPTYATMSHEQLLALPVGELADEDCHLYLWITNRSLPKGFSLLERWGFRYVTCLTWVKPSFGMGNYFRGQTEHVLFGVKGSQPLKRKDVGTVFHAPRGPGGHSSKPVEFYDLVESCSPGPFYEMFSRSDRIGWSHWGENACEVGA
jgi:N6-adenosine-specific RNA methylase IME4